MYEFALPKAPDSDPYDYVLEMDVIKQWLEIKNEWESSVVSTR